jgi:hypothetical protein
MLRRESRCGFSLRHLQATMARAPSPTLDPAADAAALLRRLGFATLMLALPVGALLARRGAVVLVPVGIVLLVIAAALDGSHRNLRDSAAKAAMSPAGLAGGLLLAWCGLSLLWTPFQAAASERYLSIVATLGVGFAGYLALPDRMRSANLYLLPIGTGLAAIVAILMALTGGLVQIAPDDTPTHERGLLVLVVLLWPSLAWLRSRQRNIEALVLAVAVAVAAALGPELLPLIGLGIGAAAYALTAANLPLGVRVTALAITGSLALAPLYPIIARSLVANLISRTDPMIGSFGAWRRIIFNEPLRLITGHGFETSLRGRYAGLLPQIAPETILFEIWYDLGIVGALAGAAALYFGITRSGREDPPLVPAIMAAFATAYTFACLGIPTAQMWWFTALVAVVLIFVATERGQFRTKRPKASFLRPVNDR